MTAKTFTNNITRHETFEGTPGGTIAAVGGGPGAAVGTDFVYEGTQSLRRRIQTTGTDFGFSYTTTTTIDATASATNTILTKSFLAVFAAISSGLVGGTKYGIGSDATNYYPYQIGDDGTMGGGRYAYPAKGGFILLPINPNLAAWRNLPAVGTPTLTATDYYRYTNYVSATSTGENQAIDAIDYGRGYYAVGGDSTDPDIEFADFLSQDEGKGSGTAARWGLWSSQDGIYFVYGGHVVGRTSGGTVTSSAFTDRLKTLVFPGGYVDVGWNALEFDLGTGGPTTTVSMTGITVVGQGWKVVMIW